ncbi:MAG: alpha/beta fold hydrolase [Actinobacteria bacterium]|nr:alpha/beta fold hydrolase [Actinomycetota bacterium]
MVSTPLGAVHVSCAGSGPPALLLHGIGSGHAAFDEQRPLAESHGLYAWDAPGYGRSEDIGVDPDISAYAAAAALVIATLGIGPADVVGVSWGGVIATRLALEHPEAVGTLALIGSTIGRAGNPDAVADLGARADALEREGVEEWSRHRIDRVLAPGASPQLRETVRRTMVSNVRPAGFRHAARTLAGTDHRDRLSEIDVPTLVVAGAEDGVTGPPEARLLAAGISGAQMLVVPDAGHLTNQEQPAVVNAALLDLWNEGRTR